MLWPALNDPIHDSQRLFRQILQAMSEPGTLQKLTAPYPPQGSSIGSALWGTLLTLCDLDTRLWIAPELNSREFREALSLHTGCRICEDARQADFALVTSLTLKSPPTFAMGSDSYPDRSTTLLVVLDQLDKDGPWQLTGPGIETQRRLDVGNADALMALLSRNRSHFPCGFDAILSCGERLAAIPRSTRLESHDRLNKENRSCMSQ